MKYFLFQQNQESKSINLEFWSLYFLEEDHRVPLGFFKKYSFDINSFLVHVWVKRKSSVLFKYSEILCGYGGAGYTRSEGLHSYFGFRGPMRTEFHSWSTKRALNRRSLTKESMGPWRTRLGINVKETSHSG